MSEDVKRPQREYDASPTNLWPAYFRREQRQPRNLLYFLRVPVHGLLGGGIVTLQQATRVSKVEGIDSQCYHAPVEDICQRYRD